MKTALEPDEGKHLVEFHKQKRARYRQSSNEKCFKKQQLVGKNLERGIVISMSMSLI